MAPITMADRATDNGRCSCVSEVDLASILGAFAHPAIIIDRGYRIHSANDAYRRVYATTPPVCGRTCHEVSHKQSTPCDATGEECPLRQAIKLRTPSRTVHIHHSPDGPQHVEVLFYPVTTVRGGADLFLEVIKPITSPGDPMPSGRVVGKSKSFSRVLAFVRCAAVKDVPVLLIGESGSGKEIIAETLHRLSPRRDRAFVPMDCSAISASLFESELLGHERGSFTGATERRRGLVESAHGGTLFLDEVGDIPLSLQVKLLRLLETRTFRRVGSDKPMAADFRLVCATHRNLAKMVEEGSFRRDLYYRINAFPIELPALRDRPEDLSLLFDHFRERCQCGMGCRPDKRTLDLLRSYSFPGNVRELSNIVQRACLLANGGTITPEHLPVEVTSPGGTQTMPDIWNHVVPLSELERRYLLWASGRFGGDRNQLAEMLGISERTLYRKLRSAQRANASPWIEDLPSVGCE